MGIFRKKQKPQTITVTEPVMKSPCEVFGHTWKDFPPYITFRYRGRGETSEISMIETYVCTCCKKREDKVIDTYRFISFSEEKFDKEVQRFKNEYSSLLKPRGIVEDMIQDTIMVDREKLGAWERLHGKEGKEEFKLKVPESHKGRDYGEIHIAL